MPKLLHTGQPGFVAPLVWVYDEVGTHLPSRKSQGAWSVGDHVELPEGWYQVELGNIRHERNRAKLFVKGGKTTVVPTGLVLVAVEPPDQQPKDMCSPWNGHLFVSLPLDPKPGPVIATNKDARATRGGIIQVIAGYYHMQWNRFHVGLEVKAGHELNLPTGKVGPMPQKKYTLHLKEGHSRDNPGLRLCSMRSTRVLARTYWGTYNKPISNYPFKQRMWEQITIELPTPLAQSYKKIRPVARIQGRLYKGTGSDPVLLWELEPIQLPEPPVIPPEPVQDKLIPIPSQ